MMKESNRQALYSLCEEYVKITNVQQEHFFLDPHMKCDDCMEKLDKRLEFLEGRLKEVVNEEDDDEWGVHKDCEYLVKERNQCRNYAMGKYHGLTYDIKSKEKCIEELVKYFEEDRVMREAFPKQTGVLQKHDFDNKLNLFLSIALSKRGVCWKEDYFKISINEANALERLTKKVGDLFE